MSESSSARLVLGHPRLHLSRTDSTNDRARELALGGAPHGTLVTAEEQTEGRGRHGRRWSAAPRSALLMSLLLRWRDTEDAPALLPLAAAVAVCDVVGPEALVKWPNDVVLRRGAAEESQAAGERLATDGKYGNLAKLAGILIEGRPQGRWLVLGIGLNVAVDVTDLPAEVRATAATMGKPSRTIEPTLQALLQALERRIACSAPEILAAWRGRDALVGSQVAWQHGSGQAMGISDHGALIVRQTDRTIIELDSGEVSLLAAQAPTPDLARQAKP